MLTVYGTLSAVVRRPCSICRVANGVMGRRFRSTTVPEDDGKLPLKGLRVLDMSRVLAGVSLPRTFDRIMRLKSTCS